MNGSVPLGQYIKKDSFIHKLDPRTKILCLIAFVAGILIPDTFVGLGAAMAFFAIVVQFSKIGWMTIIKSLKAVMFILIISVIINLFMTSGNVLISIGPLTITEEGLKLCVRLILRLFLIVAASSIVTFTTTPTQLTEGISSLLSPLKKIKVPVEVFSMITAIALRFIPTLYEEAGRIVMAQKSRGADFESRNIAKKFRSYISIIVPLLVSAFIRADELANAMDARGYDSRGERTHLNVLRFGYRDLMALIAMLVLAGAVVASEVIFASVGFLQM